MRKLTNADIKDLREYERERDAFLAEIISMKKKRRIALGDLMTIVFENAATMRFQIQEMARAERMLRDEQIAHEIETYNELVPDDGELVGTLFIEITDVDLLREWLPKLTRIQNHIAIEVAGESVPGREIDLERLTREEEITTTVHYLKFAFTDAQRNGLRRRPGRAGGQPPELPGPRRAHRRAARRARRRLRRLAPIWRHSARRQKWARSLRRCTFASRGSTPTSRCRSRPTTTTPATTSVRARTRASRRRWTGARADRARGRDPVRATRVWCCRARGSR